MCFLTNPKNDSKELPDINDSDNKVEAMDDSAGSKQGTEKQPQEMLSIEEAIRTAILEHNDSYYPEECDFACCDFALLAKEGDVSGRNKSDTIVYYGWALYQVLREGIEDVGGSHIPVALTFDVTEDGYTLKAYWEPGDGSNFVPDIRKKFR